MDLNKAAMKATHPKICRVSRVNTEERLECKDAERKRPDYKDVVAAEKRRSGAAILITGQVVSNFGVLGKTGAFLGDGRQRS